MELGEDFFADYESLKKEGYEFILSDDNRRIGIDCFPFDPPSVMRARHKCIVFVQKHKENGAKMYLISGIHNYRKILDFIKDEGELWSVH